MKEYITILKALENIFNDYIRFQRERPTHKSHSQAAGKRRPVSPWTGTQDSTRPTRHSPTNHKVSYHGAHVTTYYVLLWGVRRFPPKRTLAYKL